MLLHPCCLLPVSRLPHTAAFLVLGGPTHCPFLIYCTIDFPTNSFFPPYTSRKPVIEMPHYFKHHPFALACFFPLPNSKATTAFSTALHSIRPHRPLTKGRPLSQHLLWVRTKALLSYRSSQQKLGLQRGAKDDQMVQRNPPQGKCAINWLRTMWLCTSLRRRKTGRWIGEGNTCYLHRSACTGLVEWILLGYCEWQHLKWVIAVYTLQEYSRKRLYRRPTSF